MDWDVERVKRQDPEPCECRIIVLELSRSTESFGEISQTRSDPRLTLTNDANSFL